MATSVVETETVTLQDGEELEIKPLNLKGLRKFMKVIKGFEEAKDEEQGLDLMLEAVKISLEKKYPKIAEDDEYLEENLDMNSINRIMAVAGGVDMSGDPNQTAAR